MLMKPCFIWKISKFLFLMTDEDSTDEGEESPSTLSRKQLLAKASVSVDTLRSNVNDDWDSTDEMTLSGVVNKQIKLFEHFLIEDEMQLVCLESTNYARQKGNHVFTMTIKKFKSSLAILSGYNELPRQEMYWEKQEDTYNTLPASLLSENEFEDCKKYLHLCDNNARGPSDKFAKMRPLFDAINKTFLINYQPSQHVSTDESMVPYFCRDGEKQYIHGKPIKFGCKLWVMATPLGYCIQF